MGTLESGRLGANQPLTKSLCLSVFMGKVGPVTPQCEVVTLRMNASTQVKPFEKCLARSKHGLMKTRIIIIISM